MQIVKMLTALGVLVATALPVTSAQAAHRDRGYDEFLSVARDFEYAARRVRRALHGHGGHYRVAKSAERLTRAARRLRHSIERGVPVPHIQRKLGAVGLRFRELRREYRYDDHLRHDFRVARSFRSLRFAHRRLHQATRWAGHPGGYRNGLRFSLSFAN